MTKTEVKELAEAIISDLVGSGLLHRDDDALEVVVSSIYHKLSNDDWRFAGEYYNSPDIT